MEKLNISLLKKFCETPGVSGFENKIRKLIKSEVAKYADEIKIDSIGNLIIKKKGKSSSKKIMITAHMDEIGFMVSSIDKNGFIKFVPLGGFDAKTLTSQKVYVHGREDLLGVMGTVPVHVMSEEEKRKVPVIEDYFIDVGLPKEKVEKIIPIGSSISRKSEFNELGDCFNCKAIDNRISVFVLSEVLKIIKEIPYDLYAVFTVQEEIGLRGAKVAAIDINPDYGINLDTGIANDIPANKSGDKLGVLGKGPGIKRVDRSVVCDQRMVRFLEKTAEKNNIPYQTDIKMFGGTDTSALQLEGRAIVGALSIVTRYLHQTIETVSQADTANAIRLIKMAIESINEKEFNFDE